MPRKKIPLLSLTTLLAITASSTFSFGQMRIPGHDQVEAFQETQRDGTTNKIPAFPVNPELGIHNHDPALGSLQSPEHEAAVNAVKDTARDANLAGQAAGIGEDAVTKTLESSAQSAGQRAKQVMKEPAPRSGHFPNTSVRDQKRAKAWQNAAEANQAKQIWREGPARKVLKTANEVGDKVGTAGDLLTAGEIAGKLSSDNDGIRLDGYEQLMTEGLKKVPGHALGLAFGPNGRFVGDVAAEAADWANKQPLDILADEQGRPRSINEFNGDKLGEAYGEWKAEGMRRQQEEFSRKHRENYQRLKAKAAEEQRQAALEVERQARQRQAAAEQAREAQASQVA